MSISTARYAQPSTGTVNKIAEVTFSFWILKILATTLGESTGDLIAQTLNLGYVAGLAITGATTAGTEISDMMDRTLGLGYLWGSVILTAGLLISLYVWYRREGNLSVDPITRRDAEIIFWIAVLFSNSLGTAFGDFLVDNLGLGYMAAAALCTAIIAGVMVLHYTRSVNETALFWIAFIFTRPFGATFGDLLTKPVEKGGLDLGTLNASIVCAMAMLAVIFVSTRQDRVRHGIEANGLTE